MVVVPNHGNITWPFSDPGDVLFLFWNTDQWEIFRILKWRYVSTIFLAIFCGDIPLHRPNKNRPKIYGIGTSNQSVPESWPLNRNGMWIGFFNHQKISELKARLIKPSPRDMRLVDWLAFEKTPLGFFWIKRILRHLLSFVCISQSRYPWISIAYNWGIYLYIHVNMYMYIYIHIPSSLWSVPVGHEPVGDSELAKAWC